jgi:hypothetical protein
MKGDPEWEEERKRLDDSESNILKEDRKINCEYDGNTQNQNQRQGGREEAKRGKV